MTDVRLTATNPDDSSIVPVACNTRGELLIEDVSIENIQNDLTIDGSLILNLPGSESVASSSWTFDSNGNLFRKATDESDKNHDISYSGFVKHSRIPYDGKGYASFCSPGRAISIWDANSEVWSVSWTGVATASNFQIALEPDDPNNYSVLKSADPSEPDERVYQGPVLDVFKELEFLRAQVRSVMERLKMVPEGGWEVWDGSA